MIRDLASWIAGYALLPFLVVAVAVALATDRIDIGEAPAPGYCREDY